MTDERRTETVEQQEEAATEVLSTGGAAGAPVQPTAVSLGHDETMTPGQTTATTTTSVAPTGNENIAQLQDSTSAKVGTFLGEAALAVKEGPAITEDSKNKVEATTTQEGMDHDPSTQIIPGAAECTRVEGPSPDTDGISPLPSKLHPHTEPRKTETNDNAIGAGGSEATLLSIDVSTVEKMADGAMKPSKPSIGLKAPPSGDQKEQPHVTGEQELPSSHKLALAAQSDLDPTQSTKEVVPDRQPLVGSKKTMIDQLAPSTDGEQRAEQPLPATDKRNGDSEEQIAVAGDQHRVPGPSVTTTGLQGPAASIISTDAQSTKDLNVTAKQDEIGDERPELSVPVQPVDAEETQVGALQNQKARNAATHGRTDDAPIANDGKGVNVPPGLENNHGGPVDSPAIDLGEQARQNSLELPENSKTAKSVEASQQGAGTHPNARLPKTSDEKQITKGAQVTVAEKGSIEKLAAPRQSKLASQLSDSLPNVTNRKEPLFTNFPRSAGTVRPEIVEEGVTEKKTDRSESTTIASGRSTEKVPPQIPGALSATCHGIPGQTAFSVSVKPLEQNLGTASTSEQAEYPKRPVATPGMSTVEFLRRSAGGTGFRRGSKSQEGTHREGTTEYQEIATDLDTLRRARTGGAFPPDPRGQRRLPENNPPIERLDGDGNAAATFLGSWANRDVSGQKRPPIEDRKKQTKRHKSSTAKSSESALPDADAMAQIGELPPAVAVPDAARVPPPAPVARHDKAFLVEQTTELVCRALLDGPWPCLTEFSVVVAGLRQFASDIIVPALYSADPQPTVTNDTPIILGTLLMLREALILNADTIFGIISDDEQVDRHRRRSHQRDSQGEYFAASTLATSILLAALDSLGGTSSTTLAPKFLRIIDAYESGQGDFAQLMVEEEEDPSPTVLCPNGTLMRDEERDAWRASYRWHAQSHPTVVARRHGPGVRPIRPNAVHISVIGGEQTHQRGNSRGRLAEEGG